MNKEQLEEDLNRATKDAQTFHENYLKAMGIINYIRMQLTRLNGSEQPKEEVKS